MGHRVHRGGFDAPDGIAPVDAYQTLFAFLAGVTVVAICIYLWIQDVSVRGEAVSKTAKGNWHSSGLRHRDMAVSAQQQERRKHQVHNVKGSAARKACA